MFMKLCIVSWVLLLRFYFIIEKWCYAFKVVNVERNPKYPWKELNLAKPPPSWGQGCSLWKKYGSKENVSMNKENQPLVIPSPFGYSPTISE